MINYNTYFIQYCKKIKYKQSNKAWGLDVCQLTPQPPLKNHYRDTIGGENNKIHNPIFDDTSVRHAQHAHACTLSYI